MVVVDLTQLFPASRAVMRDVYYQATGVCNNPRPRHYSMAEATRAVLRNKTDGPWPEDLAEAPPDLESDETKTNV
jgi:hypothetical protein